MAAVSLPSGPVSALHPETEIVKVEGACHWVLEWMGEGHVDCEAIVSITEGCGNIERWGH